MYKYKQTKKKHLKGRIYKYIHVYMIVENTKQEAQEQIVDELKKIKGKTNQTNKTTDYKQQNNITDLLLMRQHP